MSDESNSQQAWWDSFTTEQKIAYVTQQHAKYPNPNNPDQLAIDIAEIKAAAVADVACGRGSPGWFKAYYAELLMFGIERVDGYNRLVATK